MSLKTAISDFLRDGQYRLAELTGTLKNQIHDPKSDEYKKLNYQRRQIWALLQLLYSGYRHMYQSDYFGFYNNWTEQELLEEIERVRNEVRINEIPWLSFGQRKVEVVLSSQNTTSDTTTNSSENIQESEPGYNAVYDDENTLKGIPFPKYIGWVAPSISEYFSRNVNFGYLLSPTYTATEWTTENPLLNAGEKGYELNGQGVVIGQKVGPGRWNDLPYFGEVQYTLTETSNPIGDAQGDLSGLTTKQVLEKMLNPYVAPVISALVNNAGGNYSNSNIIEIGLSISGTISIQFTVSNDENLSGVNPITVEAGGIFSNEGSFANGQIDLSLISNLSPDEVTTYEIRVKATHINGDTVEVSTFVGFYPKIIWGVSPNETLTASQLANISGKKTKISNDYTGSYAFDQAGYLFLAIPSMLNPSNLIFSDVTNPDAVLPMDMIDMGQLIINNGVGEYAYQVFRSTYNLSVNQTTIKVS